MAERLLLPRIRSSFKLSKKCSVCMKKNVSWNMFPIQTKRATEGDHTSRQILHVPLFISRGIALLCPPYSSDLSAIRSPERALKRIIFHNPLPTTRYIGPTGNHAHVLNSMPHVRGTKVKITASWDVTPCSLVEANRRFRDEYCLFRQDDEVMMAVRTSETSDTFYQPKRRNIPQDSHLHSSCFIDWFILGVSKHAFSFF